MYTAPLRGVGLLALPFRAGRFLRQFNKKVERDSDIPPSQVSLLARVVPMLAAVLAGPLAEAAPAKNKWVQAKAYVVPKETATEGEGYFAIIEGHNGRLYIGTHANAVNSWLVEFDPAAEHMKVVVDAHKAIGKTPRALRPGQDPHTQQCRRLGQDLFRHQAGLPRQEGGSTATTPAATP